MWVSSFSLQDQLKAVAKFGSAVECDEYPFNASKEGGYRNFKQGRVSARFIPKSDNQGFGNIIKLATAKMRTNQKYIVYASDSSPFSFFISGRK